MDRIRSRPSPVPALSLLTALPFVLSPLEGARAATVLTFNGGSPPGTFAEVTPGGGYGPELVYPDATVDGGVRLTNYQPREDLLDDEVYATSDFSPLSEGTLLPGAITATFAEPVRGVRLSIQDWFLAAPFRLEAYDADDALLASDVVSLDTFTVDPGDAGTLVTVAEGTARIVVTSLQFPGEIDFAIDNLTFESGPVFTNDTPDAAVEIPPNLPAVLEGSSRFVLSSGDEPTCSCGTAADGAPLWFALTALRAGTYVIETLGSTYDTVVSIWRDVGGLDVGESAPAGLPAQVYPTIEVACDDDGGGAGTSRVEFEAEEGVRYLVWVSEYAGDRGGDLEMEVAPEPRALVASLAVLLALTGLVRRRPHG